MLLLLKTQSLFYSRIAFPSIRGIAGLEEKGRLPSQP